MLILIMNDDSNTGKTTTECVTDTVRLCKISEMYQVVELAGEGSVINRARFLYVHIDRLNNILNILQQHNLPYLVIKPTP